LPIVPGLLLAIWLGVLLCGWAKSQEIAGGEQRYQPGRTSRLWGQNGENWSPQSRLPDFSHAGYRRGEEVYRVPSQRISVTAFGAKGDGLTDDTEAFRKAIAAGAGKVIEIPAGRYLLSGILEIRSSGTVLRGAGADKTFLVFTTPGDKLDPRPAKTDGGQPTTNWSWWGGLIVLGRSGWAGTDPVPVTAEQRRGDRALRVEKNPYRVGDEVLLELRDDRNKSLLQYLYRGQPGDISGLKNWRVVQVFRVVAIDNDRISLDRPLRFDVRLQWQPKLYRFAPAVTDVGLEGVCFDFPVERYAGHFREVGWNPVEISANSAHCWLRNLRIRNADNGPFVAGFFCTVEDIHFEAVPERLGRDGFAGHHGITLVGHDCLARRFRFDCRFIHDLTVQSAIGCVFAEGSGLDINFDHHRWAPYENLFTDIDAGRGSRLFASSGGGMRGNHSAAGATFWGIRTQVPVPFPQHFGISDLNLVGVPIILPPDIASDPSDTMATTRPWVEPIPWEELQPRNLFEAQRQFRRAGKVAENQKQ
jgi:hypothetical protein